MGVREGIKRVGCARPLVTAFQEMNLGTITSSGSRFFTTESRRHGEERLRQSDGGNFAGDFAVNFGGALLFPVTLCLRG